MYLAHFDHIVEFDVLLSQVRIFVFSTMPRRFIFSLSTFLQLQKPWTQHHSTESLVRDGSEAANARDPISIHLVMPKKKRNFGARARLPGDKDPTGY